MSVDKKTGRVDLDAQQIVDLLKLFLEHHKVVAGSPTIDLTLYTTDKYLHVAAYPGKKSSAAVAYTDTYPNG